jgi:hypothetical protein
MRAIEFLIESNNIASAEQVWDYVDGSHPKDQQGGGFLKSLVMLNPQYELKRVPLSSLQVPNDKDEGNGVGTAAKRLHTDRQSYE